jgi:hypothetical protein
VNELVWRLIPSRGGLAFAETGVAEGEVFVIHLAGLHVDSAGAVDTLQHDLGCLGAMLLVNAIESAHVLSLFHLTSDLIK